MAEHEELVGEVEREIFRADGGEGRFAIHALRDRRKVVGESEPGEIIVGLPYRFKGRWETSKYGPQFRFFNFVKAEPHSRRSVQLYLSRFAKHIGQAIASRIITHYGTDNAISALREKPLEVAENIRGLSPDQAEEAAEALRLNSQFEETKVDLYELLSGRGFPSELYTQLVRVWGVSAPTIVRRDPFRMMVRRLPGCGFLRCDQLYLDLGLPPNRLKRQMLAAWHFMKTDMAGHVWFPEIAIRRAIRERISGAVDPDRAIHLGIRAGWIASRWVDPRSRYIAEADVAEDENRIHRSAIKILSDIPF